MNDYMKSNYDIIKNLRSIFHLQLSQKQIEALSIAIFTIQEVAKVQERLNMGLALSKQEHDRVEENISRFSKRLRAKVGLKGKKKVIHNYEQNG